MIRDVLATLSAVQQKHAIASDYEKTLALLHALKAGSVSLDDVTMTDDGWQLVSPAPRVDVLEPGEIPQRLQERLCEMAVITDTNGQE